MLENGPDLSIALSLFLSSVSTFYFFKVLFDKFILLLFCFLSANSVCDFMEFELLI